MGPFLLLNAGLVGFFGFAAIYHLILWQSSRREALPAVFSADCTVRAAFSGLVIAMATATTPAEAQYALQLRVALGMLMMVTWVWSLSLVSEVRARWFVWSVTVIFLVLLPIHIFLVPLNASVISVEKIALPWGEVISKPHMGTPRWWIGPIYALVISIEFFGLYCGWRLRKLDRTAGLLILLSTFALQMLHVTHLLRVYHIVEIPVLGVMGHVFWGCMVGLSIARRNHRLAEELRSSRQRLEVLSRQLIATQETERRHLARELHDEIGQVLTAIKMNLRGAQRAADPRLQQTLEDSMNMVDQAINQVRNLSLSLRPPHLDELGLVAALHWLVKHQARLGGFEEQLEVDLGSMEIPADLETVCFRIAQEALTNAVRHGEPGRVHVKLQASNVQLRLSIHDDGIGFDVNGNGIRALEGDSFGLISMEERASLAGGQIRIESSSGHGTRIDAWFPLSKS